jgi:sirohydrochlorin cobaltochelatase
MNKHDVILLVGHGSRDPKGNEEIERFADTWRQRRPDARIEVCFIEFAEVLLDEGLDRAARQADRVVVVPLILGAAGHVKMEIPQHVEEARKRHPAVEFVVAPHLGANEEILEALGRSLGKAMRALDMPDPKTTGVVLLARGSSDMAANGEAAKMARWLFERSDHAWVDLAFTGITWPRLESVVRRQALAGMTQIVVLPYYLFTGVLIERIRRQVVRLRGQYPQVAFSLGDYIGFDEAVFALLDERVRQAGHDSAPSMLECDGCKYRAFAAEHGEGHHHH